MVLSPMAQPQPGAATRRPRAFGRTSNIWQYVEAVHERLAPPPLSKLRGSPSHPGDQLRRTSLDFDEEDEDEDSDDDPRERRRESSGLQFRQSFDIARDSEAQQQQQQLVKRKFSKNLAQGGGARHKRSSKTSLKGVSSLPELHPPTDSGAGKGGSPTNGAAWKRNLNYASLGGGVGVGTASTSPGWRRGGNGTGFSSTEIIKRIQALGTSASAPYLAPTVAASGAPLGAPAAPGQSLAGSQVAPQPGIAGTGAASSNGASAPVPTPAVPPGAVSQPPAALSDAEKLRNDFNSQQSSKLYFGCSVALELFNGHLMMVGSPDGQVRVQSLEKLQVPQIRGCRDRAIFTLIDLTDVRSANTICYGDAVWLQLSIGTGEVSWEQGGVLGAQVREAPQLKALALSSDDSIRNTAQAPAVVGHPVPVKAYLPKSREDGDAQADEIQSRVRNKGSRMLGKWIVRSAVMGPRRHKDNFVYNNDEVYLEQDWFYLGADSDAGVAVLRQLPPASSIKDVKDGEYLIERRAAWRIRLLDSTNGGSGLSLAQQQMERLLFRAKMQLKQSKKMRAGQTKTYAPDLQGGGRFTSQLRTKIAASTSECDQRHMERQDRRLGRLATHLSSKAEAMNRRTPFADGDGDFEFPTAFNLRDESSGRAHGQDLGHASLCRAESSPPKPHPSSVTAVAVVAEITSCADDTPDSEKHVCALCQSSTIGYNLCSQIQSVMHAIKSESELERTGRLNSQRGELKSGGNAKSTSRCPPIAACDAVDPTSGSSETTNSAPTVLSSRRRSRMRDTAPVATPPQHHQQQLEERERILQLFSLQDTHMLDIIKFKERTAQEALVAKEHARMGLSPVASHFRDRFKHIGLLAQAQTTDQHGIGGLFQKLHAELVTSGATTNAGRRKPFSHVEMLAQELGTTTFTIDQRTCPIEYPGEGFDVFGNPVDQEAPDPVQRLHVFPSDDELELIAPVDTKAVMEIYSHNSAAVAEMLDGFLELCETQMVPNLRRAMEVYNRASLVEILEFTARAAEFVCARRVQVRVAWLLHEIAECAVGEFAAFKPSFDALLSELEATLAFIRFFREKGTTKRRKARP